MGKTDLTIFTIGHSNHAPETFVALLNQHQIELVADVRSSPYSRYASHFNKDAIHRSLQEQGIEYLFLGDVLGGEPQGAELYDADGRVLYDKLAQSPKFQKGISRILDTIKSHRVAVLCGEEDPTNCHRRLLVGCVLREKGADIVHIRGDGRLESEDEVSQAEEFRKNRGQQSLFDMEEIEGWKSTRSVSPRKAQPNSSRHSSEPESNE